MVEKKTNLYHHEEFSPSNSREIMLSMFKSPSAIVRSESQQICLGCFGRYAPNKDVVSILGSVAFGDYCQDQRFLHFAHANKIQDGGRILSLSAVWPFHAKQKHFRTHFDDKVGFQGSCKLKVSSRIIKNLFLRRTSSTAADSTDNQSPSVLLQRAGLGEITKVHTPGK